MECERVLQAIRNTDHARKSIRFRSLELAPETQPTNVRFVFESYFETVQGYPRHLTRFVRVYNSIVRPLKIKDGFQLIHLSTRYLSDFQSNLFSFSYISFDIKSSRYFCSQYQSMLINKRRGVPIIVKLIDEPIIIGVEFFSLSRIFYFRFRETEEE